MARSPLAGSKKSPASSNGTFNQSGGVNSVSNSLVLGNVLGVTGNYNMSNGATLNVNQNLSVGDSVAGLFNMTGGTSEYRLATGSLGLVIGDYANSSGTFTISGGTSTRCRISISLTPAAAS